jgi:type II secretory pathway pseudopilin PulG
MLVVMIIGLLASIAFPGYDMIVRRAKTSERPAMMAMLERVVKDYYAAHERFPDIAGPGVSTCNSPYNPATVSGKKKPWLQGLPCFKDLQGIPDGPVYFTYRITATQAPGLTFFVVEANGDLDSDGTVTTAYRTHVLDSLNGDWYVAAEQIPPVGED